MSEISQEATTGAKWWADQLRSGFTPNNGSAGEEGTVANLIQKNPAVRALFAQDTNDLTPEKIDRFEQELAKRIESLLEEEWSRYGSTFGVDYHPDAILSNALEAAEIRESMTVLPWKTHMKVQPGTVKVAAGYGASFQELLGEGVDGGRD